MTAALHLAVVTAGRDSADTERFAEAVARQAGIAGSAVASIALAPAAADFVVADLGEQPDVAALPTTLWPRLVPLGIDRAQIAGLARRYAPAALIEYAAWRNWARGAVAPAVIVGRRDLGRGYELFAEFDGSDYAMFERRGLDLPALLADYLHRLKRASN